MQHLRLMTTYRMLLLSSHPSDALWRWWLLTSLNWRVWGDHDRRRLFGHLGIMFSGLRRPSDTTQYTRSAYCKCDIHAALLFHVHLLQDESMPNELMKWIIFIANKLVDRNAIIPKRTYPPHFGFAGPTPALITPGNSCWPTLNNRPMAVATAATIITVIPAMRKKGELMSFFWQAAPPQRTVRVLPSPFFSTDGWHLHAKQSLGVPSSLSLYFRWQKPCPEQLFVASTQDEFVLWHTGSGDDSTASDACGLRAWGAVSRCMVFRGSESRFDGWNVRVFGISTTVTSLPLCEKADTSWKKDFRVSLGNAFPGWSSALDMARCKWSVTNIP